MISAEFAPNETSDDAFLALRLLFQPWKWKRGKEVTKLRQRLRRRFFSDKVEIHLFLTGRSALYQYLKSLGLKQHDEVIIQAFTCEAVILPIISQKLTPIYVDINREDLSMNIEDLKKKYTDKAKVLILQHTFGITPVKRSQILAFAKEKKLAVLEDLAHGFDTALFNNRTHSTSQLISFGRSKSISGVFGGGIVTKYKKISDYLALAEKKLPYPSSIFLLKMVLYKFIAVLIKASYRIFIGKIIHVAARYLNLLIPEITKKEKQGEYDQLFSKSFPNISAIFILHQLNRFNDVMKNKASNSKYFQEKFRQSKVYDKALLRFPFLSKYRDKTIQVGRKKDIYFGKWYDQVVAPKSLQLSKIDYKEGSCPEAENICNQVLNLPTNITKQQAQQIVKIIKSTN